jgi:hypothetical protein
MPNQFHVSRSWFFLADTKVIEEAELVDAHDW